MVMENNEKTRLVAFLDFVKDEMKPDLVLAFTYSCPSCGHSDKVHTMGGAHPKSWPCLKCNKEIPRENLKRLPPFPKIPDKDY